MRTALAIVLGVCLGPAAQEPGAPTAEAGLEQFRFLGTLDVARREPRSAFQDVIRFVVTADGRFVCARQETLVVIDGTTGERVSEIPLHGPGFVPELVGGDGDRVYLTRENRWFAKDPSRFTAVDLGSREVVGVPSSTSESARDGAPVGIAWLPEGRVVTASASSVRCWTPAGVLVWSLSASDPLPYVDRICATTDGRIALLDRRGASGVSFVESGGRIGPYVPLDPGRSWREVLPAPDGGLWLVAWSPSGTELVRTDAQCRPLDTLVPRYANGARLGGPVAVSPAGEMWIVDDGRAFARIRPDGIVDRVVGERREGAPLREASRVRVGADDRIYAASARDHAVHGFDPEGHELFVVRPVAYDANGAPTAGLEGLEWVERRWFPVDGTRLRWEVEDRSVRLVDAVLGEVRRHEEPETSEVSFGPAGTSPDGLLAVALSRTSGKLDLVEILLFRPEQADVARLEPPRGVEWVRSVAYDGQRIAIASLAALDIVRLDGRPVARAKLDNDVWPCSHAPDSTFRVDFARRGSELWVRRGEHGTRISRYASP